MHIETILKCYLRDTFQYFANSIVREDKECVGVNVILHKKRSFPLRLSSVNVAKSTV